MQDLIRRIQESQKESIKESASLSRAEISAAVELLLQPTVALEEKAGFLSALHARGESPEEIAALVEALLGHAVLFAAPQGEGPLLDVCGTGGDKAGLFNVSTTVLFVVAACGVRVVKHGNRGLTSKSGGADVLEALGVPIDLPPGRAGDFLERHGFVFLFAPHYHPAFREIAPVRQFLAAQGQTTVFNLLGPLLNPARPTHQLAGVFQPRVLNTYAEVFHLLGRQRAWAVHGRLGLGADAAGLDEISTLGPTQVVEYHAGELRDFTIHPNELGSGGESLAEVADLKGGTPAENAALLVEILAGKERGPKRELVVANAAAALLVAEKASTWGEARSLVEEAIDSGCAAQVLEKARQRA